MIVFRQKYFSVIGLVTDFTQNSFIEGPKTPFMLNTNRVLIF